MALGVSPIAKWGKNLDREFGHGLQLFYQRRRRGPRYRARSPVILDLFLQYVEDAAGDEQFWPLVDPPEVNRLLGVCLYICGDRSLLYCVFRRGCHAVGAASCQLKDCLLRLVCRLRLLVLLELRVCLIVLDVCQARSDRLLTRQQLQQKGHDCWVCCCDGRDGSHAVALRGDLHRGDCSIHSNFSHLDMPVSLADWPARVGDPHAESRSILMGTLLDSCQFYGATRSRSPVPQAAVSGKRDCSSVAAVWAILFFSSRDDRQKSFGQSDSLPSPPFPSPFPPSPPPHRAS